MSTPRLFQFMDFTRMPVHAVELWVRCCGTVPLTIWIPHQVNDSTRAALALKPDLPSNVARIFHPFTADKFPLSDPNELPEAVELRVCHLPLPGANHTLTKFTSFKTIRTLEYFGALSHLQWRSGIFPESLESVTLHQAHYDVAAPDAELLSSRVLLRSLSSLRNLRHFSLAAERLLDNQTTERLDQPLLNTVSIALPVNDYATIFPTIPDISAGDRHLKISPHHWDQSHFQLSTGFVSSLCAYVKRYSLTIRCVRFVLRDQDICMNLQFGRGGLVSITLGEYVASPFSMILAELNRSEVVSVVVEEKGVQGRLRDEIHSRRRNLSGVFQLLDQAQSLTIRGDFGVAGQELLLGLAGKPDFASMYCANAESVVWPSLRHIHFDSICRGIQPACGRNLHVFLGLILLIINHDDARIQEVRVSYSDFAQHADQWSAFVSRIKIDGMFHQPESRCPDF